MTLAIWALLVALATNAGFGSEVGVTDYEGNQTVLICDAVTCVGFALVGDAIVELPQ